jgi:hypothetical protein
VQFVCNRTANQIRSPLAVLLQSACSRTASLVSSSTAVGSTSNCTWTAICGWIAVEMRSVCLEHRLDVNRPTKRGKEKSLSLLMPKRDGRPFTGVSTIFDRGPQSANTNERASLLFYSVGVNANSMV